MSENEINKLIAKNINRYLNSRGKTQSELASYMNVSQATVSNWCKGVKMPRMDKIDRICEYFCINRSDLMEDKQALNQPSLTNKDEKDIKKDLDRIMNRLANKEAGPAAYDGAELSPEAQELFLDEMEIALKRLKIINKEKYNPNKNKK